MKKKNLEQTFEQAFVKGKELLPEDKYFKKIWSSIENKAPVGEKYYLRFIFTLFFFFLFLVVFILFYSDFLSSVLTLKEIRKENTAFYASTPGTFVPSFIEKSETSLQVKEIAQGITLQPMEKSTVDHIVVSDTGASFHFIAGHAIIQHSGEIGTLTIHLPDLDLFMSQGRLNLFSYDGMVRIVPLNHSVQVQYRREAYSVNPGQTFYLLDQKALIQ